MIGLACNLPGLRFPALLCVIQALRQMPVEVSLQEPQEDGGCARKDAWVRENKF